MEQPALIQHTRGQTLYIYAAQDPRSRTGVKRHGGRQDHGEPLRPLDLHHLQGQGGDALYNIAKLYPGVTDDEIKAANGMKSNKIMPGQVLKIPKKQL